VDGMMNEASPPLFDIGKQLENPMARTLWRFMEQPARRLLAFSAVNDIYLRSLSLQKAGQGGAGPTGADNFFATVLDVLKIRIELADEDRALIPTTGPVVIVANHPFGAIEGVVLGEILSRSRSDVRLLGNHLLHTVPELRPWIIPVDPFGGAGAVSHNVAPMKASLRWLRQGGALGVFPAGAVSHLHVREGRVLDPPWHPSVAAMARRAGATVLPVFFEGRNSALFQLAGLLHANLRTALIPSELVRRSDSRIKVRIGRPIEPAMLDRYPDDLALISYFRWKTHLLAGRDDDRRTAPATKPTRRNAGFLSVVAEPLAEAVPGPVLQAEIDRLPPEALLSSQGDHQIYIARADQIPTLLPEIGRLRELSFRAVSEGTGRACDLDRYDQDYLHLFLWSRAGQEIIGSYRIGCVDELRARRGTAGLYTSSLFKFRGAFLDKLGPALELGRSFIRPEYQRRPLPLALLWRGIGEFVVRNPRYKLLFGPVSISRAYHSRSRRIMVEALSRHRSDADLSALVAARNPPRERLDRDDRAAVSTLVKDVEDISNLVAEIETDNKGIPVLLRHYLRLGAKLLSFNVDPSFGNCLDGLIVVDLRQSDEKLLKRCMGEAGYRSFVAAP
jgi:putative hemolysin